MIGNSKIELLIKCLQECGRFLRRSLPGAYKNIDIMKNTVRISGKIYLN